MAEILGGIIAIIGIFVVYYIAQNLDTLGERKIISEKVRKLEIEAKLRANDVRIFELQLEREKLMGVPRIPGSVEAEYKVLEDKSKEEVDG